MIYHLYNVMGPKQGEILLKYDLSGIVGVMGSCFVVFAFNLFANWSYERNIIMAIVTPLIMSNFTVIFHPKCAQDSMHCFKVTIIALTQSCLLATAIIGYFYLSNELYRTEIYPRLFKAFACVTLGFFFYQTKVPECIPFLSKFPVVQLFLNSHVFWHLLVWAGEYELFWSCFELNIAHEKGLV